MDGELYRKDIRNCAGCKKGLMHAGVPLFSKITIESYGFDIHHLQEQHGLELMMGHAGLAHIMGPNKPLAKRLHQVDVLLCQTCSMQPQFLPVLEERGLAEQEDKEAAHG